MDCSSHELSEIVVGFLIYTVAMSERLFALLSLPQYCILQHSSFK
jgi:hypothetical protein